MRIAILGQQKFGKSVLEAFVGRGDAVAGVFCAPDKAGGVPDPLRLAAESHGIPVHQLPSLRTAEAGEILRGMAVDLGVMAYVLQFAPEELTSIPAHGTIQYHPSLLPCYRGPSAINWPIIRGDTRTGLTIFRPTDGLDEGPVILQKETPIGPDDTLGSVYFDRLFPMGVAALMEAADLVVAGRARPAPQDPSSASYEGWCRSAEAKINWHTHVDLLYNLIRGCDPSPGAWTLLNSEKLQLFDARKHPIRTFSEVSGSVGTVTSVGERSFRVAAHGGEIEVSKVKYGDRGKGPAAQFCAEAGVHAGTVLG
ncbi:MAG TPA: methionyl-tRNA formyltransferase [Steroidobacteraceae bacterium]|nr:methionyl-tRNA formyltransferase [Steroidobacteraceae bacterium]